MKRKRRRRNFFDGFLNEKCQEGWAVMMRFNAHEKKIIKFSLEVSGVAKGVSGVQKKIKNSILN